jgi:hypothetical protein
MPGRFDWCVPPYHPEQRNIPAGSGLLRHVIRAQSLRDDGCRWFCTPGRLKHLKSLAAWLGLAAPPRTGTLPCMVSPDCASPTTTSFLEDLGACASERRAYSADLFSNLTQDVCTWRVGTIAHGTVNLRSQRPHQTRLHDLQGSLLPVQHSISSQHFGAWYDH